MMMTLQNCKKCKVYEKKDPKADGPCACQFGQNGSHHGNQKEAHGTEGTGGD